MRGSTSGTHLQPRLARGHIVHLAQEGAGEGAAAVFTDLFVVAAVAVAVVVPAAASTTAFQLGCCVVGDE